MAALWASEPVIYGGSVTGSRRAMRRWRSRRARPGSGPIPISRSSCASPRAPPTRCAPYDAARPRAPGMLDRPGPWSAARVQQPEGDREGAEPLRAAVADGLGYALYSVKGQFTDGRPAGATILRELVALTPEAGSALWGYVLGLDLVRTLDYQPGAVRRPAPPHAHERAGGRRPARRGALAPHRRPPAGADGATYTDAFEVVLEVADEICPGTPAAGRCAGTGARRPASAARHPPGLI